MRIPEDELRSMYIDDKMSQSEIGELCGIAQQDVSCLMKKYGIEVRLRLGSMLGRPRRNNLSRPSKSEIEEMYHIKNMTQSKIAELHGVNQSTARHWIMDYGIEMRRTQSGSLLEKQLSKEELIEMYCDNNMSQQKIGELYGVAPIDVSHLMKKYGIKSRGNSESKLGNSVKPSKSKLENMYYVKGMTIDEIGKVVGVGHSTAWNWIKEYGIETRTESKSKLIDSVKLSKNALTGMYLDNGMTLDKIANVVGVSRFDVRYWIEEYGIKIRTRSELSTGENNASWRNGISFFPYCEKFNNRFKEEVRKRDDYTCQLCGCKQNIRKLDVHHIHYKKSDCYPDVVSLCRSCHTITTSGNRDYWEEHFENQLIERGLMYWSLS